MTERPDYLLTMSNTASRVDVEAFTGLVRKLGVEIRPLDPDPLRAPGTDMLSISLGSRVVEKDILLPTWLKFALVLALGVIVGILVAWAVR